MGTKLLFIGLQTGNSQKSAAKAGHLLAQKAAAFLYKKWLLPCTKGSRFLVQKADDLLHKKRPLFCTEGRRWLLSCTKGGCFLAHKAAPFLHKGLPISCTKSGHFLAQKVAAPLHQKWPIYCRKGGRIIAAASQAAQKAAAFLYKKGPIYCTKIGCFPAQKAADLLQKKSGCFLVQNVPASLHKKQLIYCTKVWRISDLRRDSIFLCNSFCGDLLWVVQNMFIAFCRYPQLSFQITVSTSIVLHTSILPTMPMLIKTSLLDTEYH